MLCAFAVVLRFSPAAVEEEPNWSYSSRTSGMASGALALARTSGMSKKASAADVRRLARRPTIAPKKQHTSTRQKRKRAVALPETGVV
jgi:hypothetical protein